MFSSISNVTDPVFVGDPSIQQNLVMARKQEGFHRSLSGAHFLVAAKFLLAKALVVNDESTCKNN
jgi:hypothetical protein